MRECHSKLFCLCLSQGGDMTTELWRPQPTSAFTSTSKVLRHLSSLSSLIKIPHGGGHLPDLPVKANSHAVHTYLASLPLTERLRYVRLDTTRQCHSPIIRRDPDACSSCSSTIGASLMLLVDLPDRPNLAFSGSGGGVYAITETTPHHNEAILAKA